MSDIPTFIIGLYCGQPGGLHRRELEASWPGSSLFSATSLSRMRACRGAGQATARREMSQCGTSGNRVQANFPATAFGRCRRSDAVRRVLRCRLRPASCVRSAELRVSEVRTLVSSDEATPARAAASERLWLPTVSMSLLPTLMSPVPPKTRTGLLLTRVPGSRCGRRRAAWSSPGGTALSHAG